jgi:hypothetical protein
LSFFDKVVTFTKDKVKENREKLEKQKALENLSKDQLLELAIDHGIPVSKSASKEDMILECASNKELTVKDIMRKLKTREKVFKPQIAVSKKAIKTVQTEDFEVEQEITRTESIKTTVKKKTREIKFEAEVSKILKDFDIVIKKDMREKDIEGQLVQALRVIIPKEKVDYQQISKRGRADIVVGKYIAIELKLITGQSQLMALKGQLHSYSKEYDKLFVLLCDQNNVLKPQTLDTFKKELKEMNIKNIEVFKKP